MGKCLKNKAFLSLRDSNKKEYEIEIGIFHEWLKFRELYKINT